MGGQGLATILEKGKHKNQGSRFVKFGH